MNQLIIEELSQTLADRFMELYIEADIVGERSVYMEVRNSGEETQENRQEISLALVEVLSELCEGKIKVTSTPLVLVVQVER